MNVDMYLLPALYTNEPKREYGIVIDFLRNSTMITKLFENGIHELIPLDSIRTISRFKEYIRFGEKNSLKIEGFDFSNSPSEIMDTNFSNKRGVIFLQMEREQL